MAACNCNAMPNLRYSLLGNKHAIPLLGVVQTTSLLVVLISGDGKQPRDSRCRSPPDFSLHGEFCKLNLQEVNNGI